jgi:hypothetical protein
MSSFGVGLFGQPEQASPTQDVDQGILGVSGEFL